MVRTVDAEQERTIALLERLVNQNSGSLNLAGVEAVGRMMRAELEPLGFAVELDPDGREPAAPAISSRPTRATAGAGGCS